jgi:SAM-dependent methyltransferase
MVEPAESEAQGYDDCYKEFDSSLMQQIRREAHDEDIGQHSWVTAEEFRQDISRLGLSRASRLLDLGCGPCGPLTLAVQLTGCHGTGVDVNGSAIAAGRIRTASLGLDRLVALHQADLNRPFPFASGAFGAVMSLDVILHLRDRAAVFREVARVLAPGGRFLLTDAGVITGSISNEEVQLRSMRGHTQFVPAGFNERMLELAGLRLIHAEDRTASPLNIAAGRLAARLAHRAELEALEGLASFERQQRYLETVIGLSRRGAISRMMYLSEAGGQPPR